MAKEQGQVMEILCILLNGKIIQYFNQAEVHYSHTRACN